MMGEDRLSSLPDDLIHRILSFLELKMVIAISILSSRHRFLWTSVPTLRLLGDQHNSATSISLSLMNYASPKIKKFLALFDHEYVTDHHIASWIRFAVNRGVEELELCLTFNNTPYDGSPRHNVLGCLLDCRSLKVLRLWGCKLNLKSSPLCLPLLTVLELERANISDLDVSGCPVLESIALYSCNLDGNLNLYAPNPCLGYLKIDDVRHYGSTLTIYAPNVQSIRFEWNLRETYIIKDLSSLRSASLVLDMDSIRREDTKSVVGLLSVLRAPILKLNHACIRVLSRLEAGRELPLFRTICLELVITLEKSDLTGMAHVMRSAPHLQALILDVKSSPYPKDPLFPRDFSNLWKSLLVPAIRSLKTIRVNFRGSRLGLLRGDPTPSGSINRFLEKWEEEFKILELLLYSCMVLEKMAINIEKEYRTKQPWPLKSELLLAFQNKVLTVPKASSTAEICFSQNPVNCRVLASDF